MTVSEELIRLAHAEFPKLSKRKLAEHLHKKHPGHFSSSEAARRQVNYYTGSSGEKDRKRRSKHELLEDFSLPNLKGPTTPKPARLPPGKGACIGDLHIPFHDMTAIKTFLHWALREGASWLLLNGDMGDFYRWSAFERDPRYRDPAGELAAQREFLEFTTTLFESVHWKPGNHEERWERYLLNNAPELLGIPDFELPAVLHCDELGITCYDSRQTLLAGRLRILHGHEIGRGSIAPPVNPARGLWLRILCSGLIHHFHQDSEHSETTAKGDLYTCWSSGCMCYLNPRWKPINKWNHGGALIEVLSPSEFLVETRRIHNGKLY